MFSYLSEPYLWANRHLGNALPKGSVGVVALIVVLLMPTHSAAQDTLPYVKSHSYLSAEKPFIP